MIKSCELTFVACISHSSKIPEKTEEKKERILKPDLPILFDTNPLRFTRPVSVLAILSTIRLPTIPIHSGVIILAIHVTIGRLFLSFDIRNHCRLRLFCLSSIGG